MRVEIIRRLRHVTVEFYSLDNEGPQVILAAVTGGRRLRAEVPFPIDVDPADLLP